MTQEDRELLLKDLCARLPYGVKVENTSFSKPQIHTLFGRVSDDEFLMLETYRSVGGEDYRKVTDDVHYTGYLKSIKPYLRPMSSMTKEEHGKYMDFIEWSHNDYDGTTTTCIDKERLYEYLNFIYSHHLDDNNFIEKGLAIEAPDGMYK